MSRAALAAAFDADDDDTYALSRINSQASLPRPEIDPAGVWASSPVNERVEWIRALAADGKSCREIAVELGASLGAVQGQAFRSRISLPRVGSPIHQPAAVAAPTANPAAWRPLPGSTPKRMEDTGENDCMWPVSYGDSDDPAQSLCCSQPRHDGPYAGRYCRVHHRQSRGSRVRDIEKWGSEYAEIFASEPVEDTKTTPDEALAALGMKPLLEDEV